MIRPLVLGCVLGLFSGAIPGPFSALIAATALRGGFWAGFRIGVVPVVTETIVMAVTALVLSQLPEHALRWMGIAGGLFIFYLATRTWRESRSPAGAEPLAGSVRQVTEGAVLAVVSPTPWVFWLLIGAPLFLASWHAGWTSGVAFLGSFLLGLVGVYVGIAGLAAYGHKELPHVWRRRILRGTAAALVVGGGVLLWQSYVGNFQRMIKGTETLETIIGDSILGDAGPESSSRAAVPSFIDARAPR